MYSLRGYPYFQLFCNCGNVRRAYHMKAKLNTHHLLVSSSMTWMFCTRFPLFMPRDFTLLHWEEPAVNRGLLQNHRLNNIHDHSYIAGNMSVLSASLITNFSLPEGILDYEWMYIYTPDITAHIGSKLCQGVHYNNGNHLNIE